jgi:hypothetical protein
MTTRIAVAILGFLLSACAETQGTGIASYPGKPGPRPGSGAQKITPVELKNVPPTNAYPSERFSLAVCAQSTCNLTVRVAAPCEISVDPQFMALSRTLKQVTLVYTMETAGYEFGPDAIQYKPRPGETSNPLADVKRSRAPNQIAVVLKNNPAHVLDYGIQITQSGKPCGVLDPGVIPDY